MELAQFRWRAIPQPSVAKTPRGRRRLLCRQRVPDSRRRQSCNGTERNRRHRQIVHDRVSRYACVHG